MPHRRSLWCSHVLQPLPIFKPRTHPFSNAARWCRSKLCRIFAQPTPPIISLPFLFYLEMDRLPTFVLRCGHIISFAALCFRLSSENKKRRAFHGLPLRLATRQPLHIFLSGPLHARSVELSEWPDDVRTRTPETYPGLVCSKHWSAV